MTAAREVPCDGCTACCRGRELIPIVEEDGDHRKWRTFETRDPLTGTTINALQFRPDGACTYFDDFKGCTIYERRPTICRSFDCRRMVRMLGLLEAAKLAAHGDEVIRAGFARLHTLKDDAA